MYTSSPQASTSSWRGGSGGRRSSNQGRRSPPFSSSTASDEEEFQDEEALEYELVFEEVGLDSERKRAAITWLNGWRGRVCSFSVVCLHLGRCWYDGGRRRRRHRKNEDPN